MSRDTDTNQPFRTQHLTGGILVSVLILSPLLVGGVPQWAQLMVAALSILGFVSLSLSQTYRRRRMRAGTVVKLFVAMAVLALVQLVPLPPAVVELLSPETGRLAGEVAAALGSPDAYFSLSLHPMKTSFAVLRYLTLLCIFLLVVERVRDSEKEGDALQTGVVILGAIVAVLTLVQTGLKSGPMLGAYEASAGWQSRRVLSTFINENHQAAFFNLVTFVALDSAFRSFGYRKRALYTFMAWGFALLSIGSGSRAGWWALLVGGVVYFITQSKTSFVQKKPSHYWGIVSGVIGLSLLVLWGADRGFEWGWFQDEEGALSRKILGMGAALKSVPMFWATGMGVDGFGEGAGLVNNALPNLYLTHVENAGVQFLVNFGVLPGIVLAILWLGVGSRMAWNGVKHHEYPGVVIGLTVVVLQNMADFSLSTLGVAVPATVLLGCMQGRSVASGLVRTSRGIPRGAMYLLGLVAISMLGTVSARYWNAGSSSWEHTLVQRISSGSLQEDREFEARRRAHFLSRPADGHAMILEAELQRLGGELEKARVWMNMAEHRIPHRLDTQMANSRLLITEGRRLEAAHALRNALSTHWGFRVQIAQQMNQLLQMEESRAWSFRERMEFVDRALPGHAEEFLTVGTVLVQEGLDGLFVAALEKRVERDPDNSVLRHGFVGHLMGRDTWKERAAQEVTHLMARFGDSAHALELQAMVFEGQSKPLQAWAMYSEASSLDPKRVRSRLGEVRLRMQLGRGTIEAGRESIGEIRSLVGSDHRLMAEYHRVLSIAAELEGKVDESLLEMRMALRNRPSVAGYWIRAIELAESHSRILDAVQLAEQWAGRMDRNHQEASKVLARLRGVGPFTGTHQGR